MRRQNACVSQSSSRAMGSIAVRLQLYLCHPFTQKGEITLHVSEELGLVGWLGTVMFAVLEMHRNRAGKVDFLQDSQRTS